MSPRTLMGIACAVAGAIFVFIGVDNLAGNELARLALTFIVTSAVIAGGVYLLGAALVLLSHETWIARVVERMKQ